MVRRLFSSVTRAFWDGERTSTMMRPRPAVPEPAQPFESDIGSVVFVALSLSLFRGGMVSMRSNEEWVDLLSRDGDLIQHTGFVELGRILYGIVCDQVRRRAVSLPGLAALSQAEQHELARDFVQEALLQIYIKLPSYRGEGAFTSWAITIALRIMGQELRRAHWQTPRFDVIPGQSARTFSIAANDYLPEAHLLLQEMQRALDTAIEEDMSPQQRRAFLARFVSGFTNEEIAQAEGASLNAIYQRIHQARLKVKQRLLEVGFEASELG
jgi:RNA polymerase sigma-70 factor (ECF subfamily)